MSASARHHVWTLDDYFAVERTSPRKHEFLDGQIYLMAGGSPRHNFIAQRTLEALGRRLAGGPCFTMPADQRIRTSDDLYTYADGSVFCGSLDAGSDQTATNPALLVEVLSDSTRTYDRGEKLAQYQAIASLLHVVLIETDGVDVEIWSRRQNGWERRVHVDRTDIAALAGLGVEVSIADLYEGAERIPA